MLSTEPPDAARSSRPDGAPWWETPYRTYQTNLREIDAGLDVPTVLRRIEEVGADAWLLNTAGIVSFYPSSLPFQRPSRWLHERPSGDLVGDAVEAAHARGVRLIARVDFSKVARDVAEQHPDWCFVDGSGEPQTTAGLYSTCPSAPYYQERSFDVLAEIIDRYPVDGFFFNWFNFNQRDYAGRRRGICQCVHCHRRFREQTGADLPRLEDWDDPAYRRWLDYSAGTLNDLAGRIRGFIGRRSPGTALILRQDPDVVFQEVNNAVDREQPLWIHLAGEFGRQLATAKPRKPGMVNMVLFLDLPYRFQPEQPGFIGLHLAQTLAQNLNPSAYQVGTPDLFAPRSIETVADLFHFHRTHERWYRGARSAARVAIVRSLRSQEQLGAEGVERVQKEHRGVYRALLEGHIPFDILSDADLVAAAEDGRLAAYDVLVLPNVTSLDDAQATALDGFVERGGGLVATADSATRDGKGEERRTLGLRSLGAERVLVRHQGERLRSAYLRVTRPEDLPGSNGHTMVALDRAFNVLELRSGAEPSLRYVPPSTYGPPEKCYWDVETDHPGLVHQRHGQGRTAMFPWPIGALFHDWSLPEYRALLVQAVIDTGRGRQVTTNAPASVEVVVAKQGETQTLLHLTNYSGNRGRSFEDPLPVRDLRFELHGIHAVTSCRSLRLGLDLPFERLDGRVAFQLPALDLYDLIVLE